MEITDISALTAQLLTVSAIVKVIVDLAKLYIPQIKQEPMYKYVLSQVASIGIVLFVGVSLFETANELLYYAGSVGAGLIAGLGSNFIHEVMKILENIKRMKEKDL